MGASVGLPAAIPLLIRLYVRKHTRGGGKQKIIVMDSGPVLNFCPYRTPKIPGKEGKNSKKQGNPRRGKPGIPKKQGRTGLGSCKGPPCGSLLATKKSRISAPGPKKSKTESKRVKIGCFSTILALFRLRLRLFGPPRELFFPILGPEGPNDPCSRAREFQPERPFPVELSEPKAGPRKPLHTQTATEPNQTRATLYMSKDGSIWQLFVLCLLALRDKPQVLFSAIVWDTPGKEKVAKW